MLHTPLQVLADLLAITTIRLVTLRMTILGLILSLRDSSPLIRPFLQHATRTGVTHFNGLLHHLGRLVATPKVVLLQCGTIQPLGDALLAFLAEVLHSRTIVQQFCGIAIMTDGFCVLGLLHAAPRLGDLTLGLRVKSLTANALRRRQVHQELRLRIRLRDLLGHSRLLRVGHLSLRLLTRFFCKLIEKVQDLVDLLARHLRRFFSRRFLGLLLFSRRFLGLLLFGRRFLGRLFVSRLLRLHRTVVALDDRRGIRRLFRRLFSRLFSRLHRLCRHRCRLIALGLKIFQKIIKIILSIP